MEKVVRIFATLEEADEANALADACQTPEPCIRTLVTLRERRHPDADQQGFVRVYRVIELERS